MDIYGNVSEWGEDDFTANYNDKDSSQDARIIVGSDVKVHRGGSWLTESDSTRSSARNKASRENRSDGIGLRLVWEPFGI